VISTSKKFDKLQGDLLGVDCRLAPCKSSIRSLTYFDKMQAKSLGTDGSAGGFNVDYFSHEWDEMDLKSSWSAMTKQKRSRADGIRLENASWRKWIQKRHGLRRLPPEMLRWKKDEDITWLYGPMVQSRHTDPNWVDGEKSKRVFAERLVHLSSPDSSLVLGRVDSTQSSPRMEPKTVKSALKRSQVRHVLEWQKCREEIEARLRRRFPNWDQLSSVFEMDTWERPSSLGSSSFYIRAVRSDTMLDSAQMRSYLYLDKNEQDLLRHMNDGPVPNPSISPISTKPSRRGRLRFSTEVEVVEYDEKRAASSASAWPKAPVPAAASTARIDAVAAIIDDHTQSTAGQQAVQNPSKESTSSVMSIAKLAWDMGSWAISSLLSSPTSEPQDHSPPH
jgi:hypothetical protein